VHTERLVDEYGDVLESVGDAVYDARAAVLREEFDGYVADTVHVRDVGYVCWPASTNGRFDAYDELCEAERAALAPAEREGFELIAEGLSRVVLAPPVDAEDFVVKLGRCGMGGGFGDGRRANLVEARLSDRADPDAPIVPSRHCSGRGAYAVYPRVAVDSATAGDGTPDEIEDTQGRAKDCDERARGEGDDTLTQREGDDTLTQREGDDTLTQRGGDGPGARSVQEVREWLSDRAPWLDVDEALAPENRCVWRGRLRTLDYSHPGDRVEPLGVPDHVDGARIVERVDERRGAGEKRDILDGGGFVPPGER
jgi:hypothetical protein